MNTSILLEGIKNTNQYKGLFSRLTELKKSKNPLPLVCNGVSKGAEYALIYSLIKDLRSQGDNTVLIIVSDEYKANKLNEFLTKSGLKSEFYPVRDFNFYNIVASRDLEHERLKVLSGVASSYLDDVVSTPEALMQYTMPKEEFISRTFNVDYQTKTEISELKMKLNSMGYVLTEIVESPGQYAIRGGICDIFPTKCDYEINGKKGKGQTPVRIELFGDEVDRIETFDAETQRMSQKIDSFSIAPSKEIMPSDAQIEKIKEILGELKSRNLNENAREEIEKELFSIQNLESVSFYDRFISLIYPQKQCLLDYFDESSVAVMCNYSASREKAKENDKINKENTKSLIENNLIVPEYAHYAISYAEFENFVKRNQVVCVDDFIKSYFEKEGGLYDFASKNISPANHYLNTIVEELKYLTEIKYMCVLVCQTETEVNATLKTLNEYNIKAFNARDSKYSDLKPGCVGVICDAFQNDGYELSTVKFALMVLSSKSFAGTKHKSPEKSLPKKDAAPVFSFDDLSIGDYVVHTKYGIGRYLGTKKMQAFGVYRDYMEIQYAGEDRLYLPVDQLDLVAKYIGSKSANGEVSLSKMYGTEWEKTTKKAKTSVKNIAKDLIQLYAQRTKAEGFAFLPDGIMEHEFDTSFEFEETDCQLKAIRDIKEDMEKPYPMDRVLCGDVGYGKTEVALRAAMKAVANNKQVAFLAPTTILAMQHYQTCLARFAGTGVNVNMISRFRTEKEQSKILRSLRRGDIDIIIGTHKLLGKSVEFKDLGLLIVDEEQRFGVAQKEKIKTSFPNIDVLTLSATPIPRTLNMTISGIRDLSVLDESPMGRVGIQSYVLEYDENIVNDAINRELHRGGQVFYLYNNVGEIYHVAKKIKNSFPNARIRVANGQMQREDIEEIWTDLVNGEVDILVTTTIIETGIDIPNANTLIIENSHRLGLAQLHQIRGRIGRGHRRAYAYFTYPKSREISEDASERLNAIRDFTELGAGFKIAMRDLEIRGAGDLLGAKQHGHIDSVGYDMYVRLLNEAVLEEKGETVPEYFETLITLSRDAFIPESYIKSSIVRMEMYKKIAHIQNETDFYDIKSEFEDRFGKMPRSVHTLCEVSLIKAYAQIARIEKVEQMREEIRLFPKEVNLPVLVEMSRIDRKNVSVCGAGKKPYIALKIDPVLPFYESCVSLIKKYIEKCKKL